MAIIANAQPAVSPTQQKHEATRDHHVDNLAPGTAIGNEPHTLFNAPDADVILCSADNVSFRVHSSVLTSTSGFFRTLLSLPQNPPSYKLSPTTSPFPEVLHLTENAKVVAGVLSMCTGQELPELEDFSYVLELLHAADKYEMPGALSVIRLALTSAALLDTEPVRVYAIACQWGWKEVARVASARTLGLDLLGHAWVRDLAHIEPPHLVALLLLHRRRRDVLRAGLDSPVDFYANKQPGRCCHCQKEVPHTDWLHLKQSWINAIEQRPEDIASGAVLQDCQLHKLFSATCQHCHKQLYTPAGTVLKLRQLLERLPKAVEL